MWWAKERATLKNPLSCIYITTSIFAHHFSMSSLPTAHNVYAQCTVHAATNNMKWEKECGNEKNLQVKTFFSLRSTVSQFRIFNENSCFDIVLSPRTNEIYFSFLSFLFGFLFLPSFYQLFKTHSNEMYSTNRCETFESRVVKWTIWSTRFGIYNCNRCKLNTWFGPTRLLLVYFFSSNLRRMFIMWLLR